MLIPRVSVSVVLVALTAAMVTGVVFAGVEPVPMLDGGGGEGTTAVGAAATAAVETGVETEVETSEFVDRFESADRAETTISPDERPRPILAADVDRLIPSENMDEEAVASSTRVALIAFLLPPITSATLTEEDLGAGVDNRQHE